MTSNEVPDAPPEWLVVINGLRYAVQFDQVLDESVVTRIADLIEDGRVLEGGRSFYVGVIDTALTQRGSLAAFLPETHGEPEFRAFLAGLRERLRSR